VLSRKVRMHCRVRSQQRDTPRVFCVRLRNLFVQIEYAFGARTPTLIRSSSGLTAQVDETVTLHQVSAPGRSHDSRLPCGGRIPDAIKIEAIRPGLTNFSRSGRAVGFLVLALGITSPERIRCISFTTFQAMRTQHLTWCTEIGQKYRLLLVDLGFAAGELWFLPGDNDRPPASFQTNRTPLCVRSSANQVPKRSVRK